MSILSIVNDMCLSCGIAKLPSLFAASAVQRTQDELVAVANEMAHRIAYNTREWQALKSIAQFAGDGIKSAFDLPSDYQRMLLTAQVRRSSSPRQPMQFVSDADEWLERRLSGDSSSSWGEWILLGGQLNVFPVPPVGEVISFPYVAKNCVKLAGGGVGDRFQNDADEYVLPERLLKLGIIMQWKMNKGAPYAEDMGTFMDALLMASGADKPSPIIIGRSSMPIGSVSVAYPWPVPTS